MVKVPESDDENVQDIYPVDEPPVELKWVEGAERRAEDQS
jgi:hypothetical protein